MSSEDPDEWLELQVLARVIDAQPRRDTVAYLADAVSRVDGRTLLVAIATGVTSVVGAGS